MGADEDISTVLQELQVIAVLQELLDQGMAIFGLGQFEDFEHLGGVGHIEEGQEAAIA